MPMVATKNAPICLQMDELSSRLPAAGRPVSSLVLWRLLKLTRATATKLTAAAAQAAVAAVEAAVELQEQTLLVNVECTLIATLDAASLCLCSRTKLKPQKPQASFHNVKAACHSCCAHFNLDIGVLLFFAIDDYIDQGNSSNQHQLVEGAHLVEGLRRTHLHEKIASLKSPHKHDENQYLCVATWPLRVTVSSALPVKGRAYNATLANAKKIRRNLSNAA